jgi:excinuclease ABC subunit C
VQETLAAQMSAAAEAMEFERAAALRDRIRALTAIQANQSINPQGVTEADVVAVHLEGGQACVQVFFIRAGQSWGNRDFYPRTGAGAEEPEILQAFLAQFYDDTPPPRLILLSHAVEDPDLLGQLLSDRLGRKVELAVPLRGEKAELVGNALRNAKESLGRRLAENTAQGKLLAGLAEAFGLDAPPRRVEVYDNSHIMGRDAVGGMVVAGPEGWMKSDYRKFTIKGEGVAGDDLAMMREVLTRRFERLLKEDPDREAGTWPDLLLIDGGQGQVAAVAEVLAGLGVDDIPFVGVAKGVDRDAGKEEFHRPGQMPFALPRNSPVLYFVQRLRDEAHRWAIGAHRAKRAKALGATPLDEIPGVGAARKRALLQHFGSAKAVARAGLDDLRAAPGISAAMAEKIHGFFHPRG